MDACWPPGAHGRTVVLPYYVPLVSDLYPMQEAFADTATAHGTHCFRSCYTGAEGQGDTGHQGTEKQVGVSFAMMTYPKTLSLWSRHVFNVLMTVV